MANSRWHSTKTASLMANVASRVHLSLAASLRQSEKAMYLEFIVLCSLSMTMTALLPIRFLVYLPASNSMSYHRHLLFISSLSYTFRFSSLSAPQIPLSRFPRPAFPSLILSGRLFFSAECPRMPLPTDSE